MKNFKKALAILLTALLLLSVIPMSVFAAGNAIDSVEIPVLEVMEEYDGYWQGYYTNPEDPDTWVEKGWFIYNANPKDFTINYTETGPSTFEEVNQLWNEGHDWNIVTNQTIDNQWQAGGEYTAQLYIDNTPYPFTVRVIENPVESVSIKPVEIIENNYGYVSSGWDEETQTDYEYFHYQTDPKEITVKFKDSSEASGTYSELSEMGYPVNWADDQSYENQWGLGNHTATFTIYGKSFDYTVKVVETPIKKITIPVVKHYKGMTGNWEGHYTDPENCEGWVENSWYRYTTQPEEITVEMKDGQIYTDAPWEIEQTLNTAIEWYDDQSHTNQWTVGKHTAEMKIFGVKYPYTVDVKENLIKSVSAKNVSFIEKVDGSLESYWDENAQKNYNWWSYNATPDQLTVTFNDNSTVTGNRWEVESKIDEKYGIWINIDIETNQSYTNQWGVGNHTAKVLIGEVSSSFNVTITESPIESIIVEDVSVIENTNGYFHEPLNAYIYEGAKPNVTVKLKDGSEKESYDGWVYLSDRSMHVDVICDTSAQHETPWQVGNTYSAEVWVGGYKKDIDYSIIENPVASLTVGDLTFPEYTNGYYTTDDNENEFYYYPLDNNYIPFTVTLKDTTVLNAKIHDGYYGVEINGKVYNIELDLPDQYDEPWDVGSYQVNASFLGVQTTFNVNITQSQVKTVTVDNLTVTEDIDSWKESGGHYYYYRPEFTVVLKDNRVFHSKNGAVEIDDNIYDLHFDDNQDKNSWTPGNTYQVVGRLGGVETEFDVTVKKSPIKDVKLLGLPIKTTYAKNEQADLKGATIRVYYTDGTYEDIFFDYSFSAYDYVHSVYLEKLDIKKSINFESYGLYEAGTQYLYLDFLNRLMEIPIKVTDSSITSLSIRKDDNEQLYVTINDKEYKAVRFECDWLEGNPSEAGGLLVLQDGENEIKYYAEVNLTQGTVSISIYPGEDKAISSNTIDECEWLVMSAVSEQLLKYGLINMPENDIEYNGTVTKDNIDYIVDFVIRFYSDEFKEEDIIQRNDETVVIKGAAIKAFADSILGENVLNLTLSEKYDTQSGNYEWSLYNYVIESGDFDGDTAIEYINNKWNVKLRTTDGFTVKVIISTDGIVEGWTICQHTYTNAADTTCDKCNDQRFVRTYESGETLKKEVDGTWWYYKDGMRCYETTLFKYSGKWFYVENGIWTTKTDLVKVDGVWYYIENGKWATTVDTLHKINGKWFLIKQGKWKATTGLVQYKGKTFYVKGGKWNSNINDLIKISGKWYFIKSGKWDKTLESLHKINGKWFLIKGGMWSATTGIVKYKGKDFYVKGGKWSSSVNTLYKKSGKYYAIKSGKWYKSKAIIKYSGKKYYCNKGYAQLKYSGKVKVGSKTYTIKKGIVK